MVEAAQAVKVLPGEGEVMPTGRRPFSAP